MECRRCLGGITRTVEVGLDLRFDPEIGPADETDGLYALDPDAPDLELQPALREELLLALPEFPLCKPDCRGICPTCGANRNEGDCGCRLEAGGLAVGRTETTVPAGTGRRRGHRQRVGRRIEDRVSWPYRSDEHRRRGSGIVAVTTWRRRYRASGVPALRGPAATAPRLPELRALRDREVVRTEEF